MLKYKKSYYWSSYNNRVMSHTDKFMSYISCSRSEIQQTELNKLQIALLKYVTYSFTRNCLRWKFLFRTGDLPTVVLSPNGLRVWINLHLCFVISHPQLLFLSLFSLRFIFFVRHDCSWIYSKATGSNLLWFSFRGYCVCSTISKSFPDLSKKYFLILNHYTLTVFLFI